MVLLTYQTNHFSGLPTLIKEDWAARFVVLVDDLILLSKCIVGQLAIMVGLLIKVLRWLCAVSGYWGNRWS